MTKNYYRVLGVSSEATLEEIKSAFRRRALVLHPDTSGMESAPFLEVLEAYSVLADPEQRERFNQQSRLEQAVPQRSWRPQVEPLRASRPRAEGLRSVLPRSQSREERFTGEFGEFRPSFDELFDRWWNNFRPISRPKAERLESLTVEIVLTADQALEGGSIRIGIPARTKCPACRGGGTVGAYECWRCEGHGVLTAQFPVSVAYPPGIRSEYVVRIPLTDYGISNFYLTVLFRVSDD